MKVISHREGYQDGEWTCQFWVHHFSVEDDNGKVVEVEVSTDTADPENEEWDVIWDGALDANGLTQEEVCRNYPEFAGYLS